MATKRPAPEVQLYVVERDAAGNERRLAGPLTTQQALQRALERALDDGHDGAAASMVFDPLAPP